MYTSKKAKSINPLQNPGGETVYELVGKAEKSGGTGTHSLAVIVIPPGRSSEKHYHKTGEETYYILSGSGRMVIDDHEFLLSQSQACLIQPYERHQITNDGEENLEFIAVCVPAWTPGDSFPSS